MNYEWMNEWMKEWWMIKQMNDEWWMMNEWTNKLMHKSIN